MKILLRLLLKKAKNEESSLIGRILHQLQPAPMALSDHACGGYQTTAFSSGEGKIIFILDLLRSLRPAQDEQMIQD